MTDKMYVLKPVTRGTIKNFTPIEGIFGREVFRLDDNDAVITIESWRSMRDRLIQWSEILKSYYPLDKHKKL